MHGSNKYSHAYTALHSEKNFAFINFYRNGILIVSFSNPCELYKSVIWFLFQNPLECGEVDMWGLLILDSLNCLLFSLAWLVCLLIIHGKFWSLSKLLLSSMRNLNNHFKSFFEILFQTRFSKHSSKKKKKKIHIKIY